MKTPYDNHIMRVVVPKGAPLPFCTKYKYHVMTPTGYKEDDGAELWICRDCGEPK